MSTDCPINIIPESCLADGLTSSRTCTSFCNPFDSGGTRLCGTFCTENRKTSSTKCDVHCHQHGEVVGGIGKCYSNCYTVGNWTSKGRDSRYRCGGGFFSHSFDTDVNKTVELSGRMTCTIACYKECGPHTGVPAATALNLQKWSGTIPKPPAHCLQYRYIQKRSHSGSGRDRIYKNDQCFGYAHCDGNQCSTYGAACSVNRPLFTREDGGHDACTRFWAERCGTNSIDALHPSGRRRACAIYEFRQKRDVRLTSCTGNTDPPIISCPLISCPADRTFSVGFYENLIPEEYESYPPTSGALVDDVAVVSLLRSISGEAICRWLVLSSSNEIPDDDFSNLEGLELIKSSHLDALSAFIQDVVDAAVAIESSVEMNPVAGMDTLTSSWPVSSLVEASDVLSLMNRIDEIRRSCLCHGNCTCHGVCSCNTDCRCNYSDAWTGDSFV